MYGSSFPPRMGRGGMGPGRPMGRPMDMGMGGRMDHGIDHVIDPNVGNVTNDPNSIHARVFVGNLNTHLMAKEDLERIFCNYGHITGISMHKGYAFVQYSNPGDARRAAVLEDGKVYANMRLDANVASEPKHGAGHVGRGQKRPGLPVSSRPGDRPGNPAWQGSGPVKKPRVEIQTNPSMKRTLVTISSSSSTPALKRTLPMRTIKPSVAASKQIEATKSLNTSSGDILICGRCRAMFPNVNRLAMHKKIQCVVKTNCKCQTANVADVEPSPLTCASCALSYLNAWDLVQHCQAEHSMAIYRSTSTQVKEQKEAEEKEKIAIKPEPADDLNGGDEVEIDEAKEEELLEEEPTESGDN